MRSMYKATGKARATATPWLSPMVKVEVAEPKEEDVDRRGRTRMKASSRATTLPKNLIASLPMQDLDGQVFRGLLFQMVVHMYSHRDGKV
jgi:hypothetical protein